MIKNISPVIKLGFIVYPALLIISAISTQLFAQASPKFPNSENRGSPNRTGGAGRRVKPTQASPINRVTSPGPSVEPKQDLDQLQQRLTFPLGDEKKQLPPTIGGAKAGASCVRPEKGKPPLTALIPSPQHIGKTVIDSPSLFWYIPTTAATMGEFAVTDDKENMIYRTTFKLPGTPGIIKLTIPNSVNLKNGQTYRWNFSIICDAVDRSNDEYLSGQIQKTKLSPTFNTDLVKAQPLEKAKIYAKNAIWYDTLSAITSVRKENQLDWESLLTSVGLEKIAKELLLDCCTLESK
jgi:hypothetical protein